MRHKPKKTKADKTNKEVYIRHNCWDIKQSRLGELTEWFKGRGYEESFVQQQLGIVWGVGRRGS